MFSDSNEASKFLLQSINDCFNEKTTISDDSIIFPKWNISITPKVENLKENMATTIYRISLPEYDTDIYECSAAVGKDQKTAIGMAQGGFMFGVMDAVFNMLKNNSPKRLTTEFAGNKHNWNVYFSNVVSMGQNVDKTEFDFYWNLLKEHISKRIGNQKLCYIKVYTSNLGNGEVNCECRINDIPINEISDILAEIAKKWNVSAFASQKQFFIIKQDSETVIESPFKVRDIRNATVEAMKLFEACKTDDDYDTFDIRLEKMLGDLSLASELYAFIPEICAENAFPEVKTSEQVDIYFEGRHNNCYKTQLASYYTIFTTVFEVFESGILNNVNEVYKNYISLSSLISALNSALKNGSRLEDLSAPAVAYTMKDGYVLR